MSIDNDLPEEYITFIPTTTIRRNSAVHITMRHFVHELVRLLHDGVDVGFALFEVSQYFDGIDVELWSADQPNEHDLVHVHIHDDAFSQLCALLQFILIEGDVERTDVDHACHLHSRKLRTHIIVYK